MNNFWQNFVSRKRKVSSFLSSCNGLQYNKAPPLQKASGGQYCEEKGNLCREKQLIKTEKIHFTSKVFALSWSQKVYKWQTHNLRTQVSLFLNRRCLHFYKGILILNLQHKYVSNCKNSSRWQKFLGRDVFLEISSNGILVPIVVFLSHNVTTNNFY